MANQYLSNLYQLKDKIVCITGATGQLGYELTKAYAHTGARVVGTDKELNRAKMIDVKNVSYYEMDVANKETIMKIFKNVYAKYEGIDILINNAGVNVFEPFEERNEESFDWVTDVNLKGPFFSIQAYVDYYRAHKKKQGAIINIASLYGIISPDYRIYTDCKRNNSEVYGAVKAGLIQMTKYFAVHLAHDNIRVNAVSPGGIYNPEKPQGDDFIKNYSYRCPLGRMAQSEEIVGGVLYLSSDAASYTTGHNLIIDGGMHCW